MRFRLVPAFTEADLGKQMEEIIGRIVRVTQNELNQLGLQMTSDARMKQPAVEWHSDAKSIVEATKLAGGSLNLDTASGFNDQTGNLRSSIGYILMYDGEVLTEDFQLSPAGTDKQTGIEAGKDEAERISKESPEGWAIILVAGMEYASWVENMGYDVISGTTLGADKKLQKALNNVLKAFE